MAMQIDDDEYYSSSSDVSDISEPDVEDTTRRKKVFVKKVQLFYVNTIGSCNQVMINYYNYVYFFLYVVQKLQAEI